MRITICCVGKVKEKFYCQAIDEYSKRLSRYCKLEVKEVADEKTPDNASDTVNDIIKAKEGERLLSCIKDEAPNAEADITGMIHDIGIPAHIKGYQYLRDSIMLSVKDRDVINSITKILYPTIAKMYQTTSSRCLLYTSPSPRDCS